MSECDTDNRAAALPRVTIGQALRNHWIEAWYQPKVDLQRKCLAGVEMVARIRHPDLGVLLPGTFVPVVDELSLIALTEYSLLAALNDWAKFAEAGFNFQLAVNAPIGALLNLRIAELVKDCRPRSERWPGVIIDVDGAQVASDPAIAKDIAEQIRGSAISIALDDLGSDGSALAGLPELPITEMKIASDFVKNCALDSRNAEICKTVIDAARRGGCSAVAQGIVSALDMQSMIVMGCDFAQGTKIAPYLPRRDLLELLYQRNAPRPPGPGDMIQAGVTSIGRVA